MPGPKSRLAKYLVGSDFTRVGDKPGGTFGGGLYTDPDGVEWYFKEAPSEDHARNEVLAAKLYREAGVNVPDVELVELPGGGLGVASRKAEVDRIDPNTAKYLPGVYEGFAADAWLANWDVAGLYYDNIYESGGQALRIDHGGALRYRAQGDPKGRLFGDTPGELDTLRDPNIAPQASRLFQDIPEEKIKEGADKIREIPEERIRELVDEYGPEEGKEDLVQTLLARRGNLPAIGAVLLGGATLAPEEAEAKAAPGGTGAAARGAGLAGLAMALSGPSGERWQSALDQDREEAAEDARNRMFGLEEYDTAPKMYGPKHPRMAAAVEAIEEFPLGWAVPFLDQVKKLAWGDRFNRMDAAMMALDATDFLGAGIMIPGKTQALKAGLRKGLSEIGVDATDDIIQKKLDEIDAEYGMDNVANMHTEKIFEFGLDFGSDFHGQSQTFKDAGGTGWEYEMKIGPHKNMFKLLEDLEAQHRAGLISDQEYKESIEAIKDYMDSADYQDMMGLIGLGKTPESKVSAESGLTPEQADELVNEYVGPEPKVSGEHKQKSNLAVWADPKYKAEAWNNQIAPKFGLDPTQTLDMVALDFGPGVFAMSGGELEGLAEAIATKDETALNFMKKAVSNAWADVINKGYPSTITGYMEKFPLPDWYDRSLIIGALDQAPESIESANRFFAEAEALGLGTDTASRMARAEEQGYQFLGYHTTDAPVDFMEFRDPKERGGVYANMNPWHAEDAAQFKGYMVPTGVGDDTILPRQRFIPLMYSGEIFGRDRPPEWFAPDIINRNPVTGTFDIEKPSHWDDDEIPWTEMQMMWDITLRPRYRYDPDSDVLIYRGSSPIVYDKEGDVVEEGSYIKPPTFGYLENSPDHWSRMMRALGYEAWQVADEGNISVAVGNPKRLRSPNAMFLPEYHHEGPNPSGNLLAGVGGLTAIPAAAIMAQLEGLDEDDEEYDFEP